MGPLLTIGVPAYNGEPYIEAALSALTSQDFTDFELHICDDGSTDLTEEICRAFVARDARLHYHRAPLNRGATANFNWAFSFCRSEFFMFAADDDIREKNFVSRCLDALQTSPDAVMAFCLFDLISPDGSRGPVIDDWMHTVGLDRHQRLWHVLTRLHWCSAIYGVMRAAAFQGTRRFRNIWGMDLAVMYELAVLGEFVKVPDVLFHRQLASDTGLTRRAQWEGFQPANRARHVFLPDLQLLAELMLFLARAPLGAVDRLSLVATVALFAGPYRARRAVARRLGASLTTHAGAAWPA